MADEDHLADPEPATRPGDGWPHVLISNRQHDPIDEEGMRSLARETLLAEGIEHAELSVSFVDADEIAELHERFMDEPGPTDVLSFPLDDVDGAGGRAEGREGVSFLGDVVVAPTEAVRNNPHDPAAELRLLLVHGILHLLGYDHEDDDERTRMWERQERYSGVQAP
ncbi:MAG TPA: rRNA maturation RNase YbeY [Actinomycetota bacterium]